MKKKAADIVYFGLYKAFDTISYNICIDKLVKFGWHSEVDWRLAELLGSKGSGMKLYWRVVMIYVLQDWDSGADTV